MDDCKDCGAQFTDEVDGGTCQVCGGKYCDTCFGDHTCEMQQDQDQILDNSDSEEEAPDWMYDAPLQVNVLPEEKKPQDPPEVPKKILPLLPLARGLNVNRIDEDYRKIGVATWNLHGLNDRRARGEAYDKEISNRLKSLLKAVGDVISVVRGIKAVDAPLKSRTRQATKKAKTATPAKVPVTDQEVAEALVANIVDFWQWVALRDDLAKLKQQPDPVMIQDLLARLQKLADADCSVATAVECVRLRALTRRMVGSEVAWKKACEERGEQEWAWAALIDPRKRHPLCPVLDALVDLDQSLNTHLVIKHINQLMAKNPWLDAFILQEVRPAGLKVLKEQLDKSLRITFGPCMAGVATTLNQREYYPVVTRVSTIQKVSSYAIACVKNGWSEPKMPARSKAKHNLWDLDEDANLWVDVYQGLENGDGALDTVNILWSKERKVYRPVVVYDLTTENGVVTIGNVHTSPGDGDDEWWRHHEYDQLETAFEAGGKDGFWLMGGDYYLSAESRVQRSPAGLKVTALDDEDTATYESVVEHYEDVTGNQVDPDTSELTVGQAQQAIFSAHSVQARPSLYILDKDYRDELRSEQIVHQPFVRDLRKAVKDTKRLDGNAAGEDIFRNVLRLTFEKNLPVQWTIAQAISGTNTHLKIHDFPAYATSPGRIPIDCIERVRRFTRARVTSKMRIADFFIFNDPWQKNPDVASLACKIGLLAPIEVGGAAGIHWYDEEDLSISRYWLSISDHFPVGGVFTTDPKDPVLKTITAAPFMAAPMQPSKHLDPEEEQRFKLVPMPQDGDCFFEGMKAALGLNETVDQVRGHSLLEDSKIPKTYVGWPDWEAVAKHYGVSLVVHEYHYGHLEDRFVGLLDEVNPNKAHKVHMRLIHIQEQSASHMDLLLPLQL